VPAQTRRFHLSIDSKSGIPLYRQITLQIELAIADGRLRAGDQLPTVRGLAVDLEVNPNTVVKAYSELELRGFVTTQQGTGTFISERAITLSNVERARVLAEITRAVVVNAGSYGFSLREVIDSLEKMASSGAGKEAGLE
jgi:GntR family transcriptional regulator